MYKYAIFKKDFKTKNKKKRKLVPASTLIKYFPILSA